MRIIDCEQGGEEWDRWRARPTASQFHRFVTPAKGEYSAQATKYACEIVRKRRGAQTIERMSSAWEEYGTDNEPNAAHSYERQFGVTLSKAGFVLPDGTDAYGGSPDRLANLREVSTPSAADQRWAADGVVEFKCTSPEELMMMHLDPTKGEIYAKPQVQGLLMVTKCAWCDFYVWHPDLEPFHMRILPDLEYQQKIADALVLFLEEIQRVEETIRTVQHELVAISTHRSEVNWNE